MDADTLRSAVEELIDAADRYRLGDSSVDFDEWCLRRDEARRASRSLAARLAAATEALHDIAKRHSDSVRDEEVEVWHDDDLAPADDCPDPGDDCPGHIETIKVCDECGTMTHPEFDVAYRTWPCPTYTDARRALAAVADDEQGTTADLEDECCPACGSDDHTNGDRCVSGL